MKLKIKKLHPKAIVPLYASEGSACFDLHAIEVPRGSVELNALAGDGVATFRTGLSLDVPGGHVMLIFSRSGHGFKNDTRLANCVGVIDSDYRGEVMVRLTADGEGLLVVVDGDRIAQAMLVPIPRVEFELVDELSETERGAGGFGSTEQSAAVDWADADTAFDNTYHKVRAEMTRDEWREKWLKGETPHQLWMAREKANPSRDPDMDGTATPKGPLPGCMDALEAHSKPK